MKKILILFISVAMLTTATLTFDHEVSADTSGVDIDEFNYSMEVVTDALAELDGVIPMSDTDLKTLSEIFSGISSTFSTIGDFVVPLNGCVNFLQLIGLMKDGTASALANIQTQLADISNKLTQMDSKLNQLTEDMTKLQATEEFHARALMANQMSKSWHDFQTDYMENRMDELIRQYNSLMTDDLKAWNNGTLAATAENGYQMDFYKVVIWYKCVNPDGEDGRQYELQQNFANDVDYKHDRNKSSDPYIIYRNDFGDQFEDYDKVLVLDERFFPKEGEIIWNVNTFRNDLKEYIEKKLWLYIGNPDVFPQLKPLNLDYYDFEEDRGLYDEIAEEAANRIIYKISYSEINESSDFPSRVVKQFREYCAHLVNSSEGLDAMLKTIYLSHAFEYETADDIRNFLNQMAVETGTYGAFACNIVSMSEDVTEADKLAIAANMSMALTKIGELKHSSLLGDGRYCYITNSLIDYGRLEMSASVEDYWRHRGSYYAYRDCDGGDISVSIKMSNDSEPVSGSLIGDSNALLLTYMLKMNGHDLSHDYMNENLTFQKQQDYNGLITSLKTPVKMTKDADICLSTSNVIGDYFKGDPQIYLNSLPDDAEFKYVNIKNTITGTLYDPLRVKTQVDKPLLAIGVYGENHLLWTVDESALLYGPTDKGVLKYEIDTVQTDSDAIANRYYTTTLTENITYNCLISATVYGQGKKMVEGGALSDFVEFVAEELPDHSDHEHLWDSGKIVQDASDTEPGFITYSCLDEPMYTITVPFAAYEYASEDLKWRTGSSSSFEVIAKRLPANDTAIKYFSMVLIDGKEVDPQNYELISGSVVIRFTPDYMKTLAVGKHELEMVFDDGSLKTAFVISDSDVQPKDDVRPEENRYRLPLTGVE